jgi:hypothetical protein
MPPSATASLLSPLSSSSVELIPGLVVLSDAPRRTGPECKLRSCCSSRTQYVRYAICRSRRKGSSSAGAVPCGLATATTLWSSSCGAAPPCSPPGREGLVSSQHRWRRRNIPYAPPQRTRCAAATPLNHASLRPLVVKDSFIFSCHMLISVPSVRAVF